VNAGDFGANYINLDKMFEVLLHSGLYYREESLPNELKELKTDGRWLTAYRYVAKNFPQIPYAEFREIVKRYKDSDGVSIYVEPSDSEFLQKAAKNHELFDSSVDLRATLLHLSLKALRKMCDELKIHSGRSIEETAERIAEVPELQVKPLLPNEAKNRTTLVIRDQKLATGSDLIRLDSYLRTASKVIRDDFVEFVNSQRFGTLAA